MRDFSKDIYILPTQSQKKIIVFTEARKQTVDQVNSYFDYLEKLIDRQSFHIIIDLSKATPPTAEIRNLLKSRFKAIQHLTSTYSVYVGTNILLKIAAKFVGTAVGLEKFKIFKSIEDAIQNITNEV